MSEHRGPHANHTRAVIEVLRREHEAIGRLIDELPNAGTPEQKQYLMDEIEERFKSHSRIEDELIRVALGSSDPSIVELARTALEADHETYGALREIAAMFPWARSYDQEVERVVERLRFHFEFEEEGVFPVIGSRIAAAALAEI